MTELSINKPATIKRGLSWLEFEAINRNGGAALLRRLLADQQVSPAELPQMPI
jgi:hypothetical protein